MEHNDIVVFKKKSISTECIFAVGRVGGHCKFQSCSTSIRFMTKADKFGTKAVLINKLTNKIINNIFFLNINRNSNIPDVS